MSRQIFPEHLYVHWPFCKNKCHYCDFVALEKHEQFIDRYHKALQAEVANYFVDLTPGKKTDVKTIFFGGGTPSLYPLPLLIDFTNNLYQFVERTTINEMTLEVNPGDLTTQHYQTWRDCGFNRVSVGVQILDEAVLFNLNRRQKTSDVYELMNGVFEYIPNVSVDLIIGLPGSTPEAWWKTVEQVLQWPITHISIYFLMIHSQTPLAHRIAKKELAPAGDDEMVALYEKTIALLATHGFVQYEISNFARPGYESEHNKAYWQRKAYKGFGLGAASFENEQRERNQKNLSAYVGYWLEGTEAATGKAARMHEVLTPEQQRLEVYMLGLRQRIGIERKVLEAGRTNEQLKQLEATLAMLLEHGFIIIVDDRIQLTVRGMVYENEVIMKLY